jgi:hypothetical protein
MALSLNMALQFDTNSRRQWPWVAMVGWDSYHALSVNQRM